jgi:hypothetical protein
MGTNMEGISHGIAKSNPEICPEELKKITRLTKDDVFP